MQKQNWVLENLRYLLKCRGFTLQELADRLDVTEAGVSRWLTRGKISRLQLDNAIEKLQELLDDYSLRIKASVLINVLSPIGGTKRLSNLLKVAPFTITTWKNMIRLPNYSKSKVIWRELKWYLDAYLLKGQISDEDIENVIIKLRKKFPELDIDITSLKSKILIGHRSIEV
ncbi:MAG: hypothetical protein ACTSRP_02135 [Candidatus Helarchaeota archaeon]